MFEVLHQLSEGELRQLLAGLRGGPLSQGGGARVVKEIGGHRAAALETCLAGLSSMGVPPHHAALVVEAVLDGLLERHSLSSSLELVLTGPDVEGVPTGSTAAVLHALVEKAEQEVLLVGYAVHNGRQVFEPLARKMEAKPSLRVTFCLDVQRRYGDERPAEEVAAEYGKRFVEKQWPGSVIPAIYYDPRALDAARSSKAALHAKCFVIDRREALITSANFTEAAQARNIELGVLLKSPPHAKRIASYFHHLIERNVLARLSQ